VLYLIDCFLIFLERVCLVWCKIDRLRTHCGLYMICILSFKDYMHVNALEINLHHLVLKMQTVLSDTKNKIEWDLFGEMKHFEAFVNSHSLSVMD